MRRAIADPPSASTAAAARERIAAMFRFKVFENGRPATSAFIDGSYLIGSEGVPLPAQITFADGEIRCTKRAPGPAGLSLLWPVEGYGRLMLETARLTEREQPYNLHVELARGRLMRISQKREDWGLYDYADGAELYRRVDEAKAQLVEAITAADEATAARHADAALKGAVIVGEELSLFHADIFLKRRRSSSQFVKRPFGIGVLLGRNDEAYRQQLRPTFDFAVINVPWREIEPRSGTYRWDALDLWVNWLGQHRMHCRGTPLVSTERGHLPEWLAGEDVSYEMLRDHMMAHAAALVKRFAHRVQSWEVVHGLHALNTLHLTLEQLMDLTRMASLVVKQHAPRSQAIISVIVPWGEYYARDVRTIPPTLYADMCVQSGFHFDAFGLQFVFGAPQEGMLVRDMLQISAMLDRFANLNKPLHITAAAVPSAPVQARSPDSPVTGGGVWHSPWSEETQARWLKEFYEIAFSKPFVETLTWRDLVDQPGRMPPTGGLLRADLTPKKAFEQLQTFRRECIGDRSSQRLKA
jgi:endo-1,4-beta-xylanase